MVTITDVSRLAGVSTATVSRVINHPDRVDVRTRQGVEAAIAELHFVPNEVARGLASQSSRTIGIVINTFSSPYYGLMLEGASRALRKVGYHLVAESSYETSDGEERAWRSLRSRQCEAIILHSDKLDDARLTALMQRFPKSVLLNRRLADVETRCVYLDNVKGGVLAAQHLVDRGHREIAMIAGPSDFFEARQRSEGFVGELRRSGLAPVAIAETCFGEAGGEKGMNELLSAAPSFSALFCHTDEMAAGAMQVCRERGRRVPESLSIIGFDNMPLAHHLTPKLTTVQQPLREMGEAAARLAHAVAIKHLADASELQKIFEPLVVLRESTRSPGTSVARSAWPST